jgi:hypothetical protein
VALLLAPPAITLPTSLSPSFGRSDKLQPDAPSPPPPSLMVEKDGEMNCAGEEEEELTVVSNERRDNSETSAKILVFERIGTSVPKDK